MKKLLLLFFFPSLLLLIPTVNFMADAREQSDLSSESDAPSLSEFSDAENDISGSKSKRLQKKIRAQRNTILNSMRECAREAMRHTPWNRLIVAHDRLHQDVKDLTLTANKSSKLTSDDTDLQSKKLLLKAVEVELRNRPLTDEEIRRLSHKGLIQTSPKDLKSTIPCSEEKTAKLEELALNNWYYLDQSSNGLQNDFRHWRSLQLAIRIELAARPEE